MCSFFLRAACIAVLPSAVGCSPRVDAGTQDAATSHAPIPGGAIIAPSTLVIGSAGTCVPWSQAVSEPFVLIRPQSEQIDPFLRQTAANLTGSWLGRASAPKGWWPDFWEVAIDFTATTAYDGTYLARAKPDGLPFYYGSNDAVCDPLRKWRITGVFADGAAGEIDVPFDNSPQGCGLPAWQGTLKAIAFDASGNRAQMPFQANGGAGYVAYDLWRACPP